MVRAATQKAINLPTLRYRRSCENVIEMYKIMHEIHDKDISEMILHLARDSRTREHSLKLIAQYC